jgi:regulation of enolase protein 1 (concanavalin A-like superfamily)
MRRKLIYGVCVTALLSLSGVIQAGVFSDSFDVAHDYLTQGVEGTAWDGFLGLAPGETASALDASTSRPGQLFLESAGAYWHEPWTPLGPFLYKMVEGDFIATVKVSDYAGTAAAPVYHNNCGLLARALPDDAGPGEDWVALDYFPIWNCGNFVRSADDNVRTENGNNGRAFNLDPWLQVERQGNTFHFRTSSDGITWTEMSQSPLTRNDLADVPLQVGLYQGTYSADSGYAAFDDFKVEGPRVVPGFKAYMPAPADGAADVLRDVALSWTPAEGAVAHDLYFGTNAADVLAANRGNSLGVALGVGQDANSYDVGRLELGQTCFWRVDEVEADGVTIHQGDLWSFTVEPVAYAIQNVVATASSSNNANTGPGKTVDGSGLTGDQHSTTGTDMWLSKRNAPEPTWIQFAFDQTYKLDHMLVWNSNQMLEPDLGLGVREVLIQYSADGDTWTDLRVTEFTQATGEPNYTPEAIPLDGIVAKYVKLTINSNWGELLVQYGLSEVRFFSIPVTARAPHPALGATDVDPQTALSWRPGREAASHQVILGTEQQAVADGAASAVAVTESQYEAPLDLAQSYFWKVVEVNDAAVPAAWDSPVWSFATADYIVVDDFESYTDEENVGRRIYETWIDGWDTPATNGGVVGYADPPFAERTVVHNGRQSMPLSYDNSSGAVYSEATRTFDPPQDWSQHAIQTLVIYFHGVADNTLAPLYAKINNTKVLCNGGAAMTALPVWKQWDIDLAGLGINLTSIKSLTLGVGDGSSGGTGVVYIDDIRLYRSAPPIVAPVDPGSGGIVANYTMDGNLQDSSGRNNHGQVLGDLIYTDEVPAGHGKALTFNGTNTYAELPLGSLVNTLSDMTISLYANFSNTGGDWQRIFDFGSGTTSYMFLSPRIGATGPMRFAILASGGTEQQITAPVTLPAGWHHVAVVIDSATMTMRLHLDGAVVASGPTSVLPKDLGNTTQNWLGRSQFTADAYYTGSLDDFRIYNRALSEGEVRYLAGDR